MKKSTLSFNDLEVKISVSTRRTRMHNNTSTNRTSSSLTNTRQIEIHRVSARSRRDSGLRSSPLSHLVFHFSPLPLHIHHP